MKASAASLQDVKKRSPTEGWTWLPVSLLWMAAAFKNRDE
jgi:hypothetical protein